MKKFIKKVLAGLAVTAALILLLNALYVNTDYYRDLGDVEKFNSVPEHIQLANFGHSHSLHSFAWPEFPNAVTMSFALGSQTYAYDYAILNQYWDCIDEGAVIFLVLSHFSMYETIETRWTLRYYRFIDRENMPDYDFTLALRNRYIPVIGAAPRQIVKAFLSELNLYPAEESVSSIFTDADLSVMFERGEARVSPLLTDYSWRDRDAHGQYEILQKFIEKCREKSLQVVLVTTPTTEYYYKSFPDDYIEAFERDRAAILEQYPEVICLDYTGDARICFNLPLFYDYDHLNYEGAVAFMQLLEEDLLPYGIDLSVYR